MRDRTIQRLLSFAIALTLASGCKLTPERFQEEFDAIYCDELPSCTGLSCKDIGYSGFELNCPLNQKLARECLKGEWVCNRDDPENPFLEFPEACFDIHFCNGFQTDETSATTGTGTATGVVTGTTGTGTGATGTGTGVSTLTLNAINTWIGSQTLSWAIEEPVPDQFNCVLVYDTVGTEITPVPPECPLCAFVFDLAFTYNPSASIDDGSCAGAGLTQIPGYTYGVRDDGAQLTLLLMDFQGNFFEFGTATYDGFGGLNYEGGTLNQPYGQGYNSGYWQGSATVTAR